MKEKRKHAHHIPYMLLSLATLLIAAWAGLIRLGWSLPLLPSLTPMEHGPLMVSGFLGTLITLERAAALGRRWPYFPPLLTILGAVALLIGAPDPIGPLLMTLGSVGLCLIFLHIIHLHMALYTITMGMGALVWAVGNLLWLLEHPVPVVVPWWMGFLVLTIAGERLELSRVMRPPRGARYAFVAATLLFTAALILSVINLDVGMHVMGVAMITLVIWLSRYDVTRHTIHRRGMVRYIAACMVLGYLWLLTGGMLAAWFGGVTGGFLYDAVLHAIFLGFVFSMIFGHALIIFPALLGVAIPYRPHFYLPLALLHGSLALRVAADLGGWFDGRRMGALLNVVAILLFLAVMLYSAAREARAKRLLAPTPSLTVAPTPAVE